MRRKRKRRPIRIKYYGMIWLTKKAYLITTLCVGIIVFGMLLMMMVILGERTPPFTLPWEPAPANTPPGIAGVFYHHFWTLIILVCVAEAIDIAVMLHKFAEKEAEQAYDEDDDD